MNDGINRAFLPPLLALLTLIGGCGGGGGGGSPGPEPDTEISEHHRMLNTLGVDVGAALAEPARDKDGNPLPDDYAPLKQKTMALGVPKRELFIAGPKIGGKGGKRVNLFDDGAITGPDGKDKTPYAALTEFNGDNAWATDTMKVSTRGDVDGDGFEEVIIFWRDSKNKWWLKVIDNQKDSYHVYDHATSFGEDGEESAANWPDVAAADVDGDGRDEVVFADRTGVVWILDDKDVGFASLTTISHPKTNNPSITERHIRVAAGDLTDDGRAETVVVVSEVKDLHNSNASDRGTATYFVYADAGGGFAQRATGVVAVTIDGSTHTAAMADVAIGDVVDDGRNEIVLGGIERSNIGAHYEKNFDPNSRTDPTGYNEYTQARFIATTLKYDEKGMISPVASRAYTETATGHGCPTCDTKYWYVWRIETATVNTLKMDGGNQYISINSRVFNGGDFSEPYGPIKPEHVYPDSSMLTEFEHYTTSRSPGNITVGDVTGDGYEDIVIVGMETVVGLIDSGDESKTVTSDGMNVRVYGLDSNKVFKELKYFAPEFSRSTTFDRYFPTIQPVNVDEDTAVVQWIEGAHRVEFTQPQVIAALAAAPCNPEWGQVGCSTSLSKATMKSEGSDTSITSKSSVTLGVSLEDRTFTQAEFELTGTVEGSLNMTAYNSASITHEISYQGGNGEDSVIFTTMPVDYYGYKVVSSATADKALGDQELFVGIPREPITRVVSRAFYNATVGDNALQIDDAVFSHTVGNVNTYPSKSAMASMVDSTNGLLSSVATPGQSGHDGSATSVSITKEQATGSSNGAGLAIGGELRVVAGSFLAGASTTVEVTGNNWLEITKSTTYAGYVASITSGQALYSFGLAVYPQTYTDPQTNKEQKFQVLNYWVGED
jgi:hypothetical protein